MTAGESRRLDKVVFVKYHQVGGTTAKEVLDTNVLALDALIDGHHESLDRASSWARGNGIPGDQLTTTCAQKLRARTWDARVEPS